MELGASIFISEPLSTAPPTHTGLENLVFRSIVKVGTDQARCFVFLSSVIKRESVFQRDLADYIQLSNDFVFRILFFLNIPYLIPVVLLRKTCFMLLDMNLP